MLHVRVGNVDFYGRTDSGFLIGPGGFKGWEGAPATRRSAADRPGAHGSVSVRAFKSSRLVTLSGHALADSSAELAHMGEVLAGVGQSEQQITVASDVGTRWGYGSVEGEIKFDRVGGQAEAPFAFTLWMPDPFKYGQTVEFPTSTDATVTMHHRGNTEATPKFRVTGTFPNGYRLYAGTRIVQVSGSASAVVDELDMVSGKFSRDGALNPRLMQIAGFWTVPGGAQVSWAMDRLGGTGTATAFVTDTYI